MLNQIKFILILITFSSATYSQNEISLIERQDIEKIIIERSGKALLINIWATWCMPCWEEFPNLIKLSEKYKSEADVIGISVDYPDEIESKIKPFAKKMNVNFPLYVNGINDAEAFVNFFDSDWNGAIPATFIYDPGGKNVNKIYGKMDFDYFENAIKQILSNPK
jgi:thiol-disulfide isomerase/thioredoxin